MSNCTELALPVGAYAQVEFMWRATPPSTSSTASPLSTGTRLMMTEVRNVPMKNMFFIIPARDLWHISIFTLGVDSIHIYYAVNVDDTAEIC